MKKATGPNLRRDSEKTERGSWRAEANESSGVPSMSMPASGTLRGIGEKLAGPLVTRHGLYDGA
jgi:hypothetical protein